MKKLFPEKKFSKKGIMEFLDKKGFYIVLILCIAVVGTVAVFVTTHNSTTPDIDMQKMAQDNSDKNAAGKSTKQDQSSMTTKAATTQPKTNDKTDKAAPSKTAPSTQDKNSSGSASGKSNTTSQVVKLAAPVSGSITFEYAEDKLVYSKTLEEWTTHSGVDLGVERGTAVKAAADGVVNEIKSDPGYGTIVIIQHANGIKTVYANLSAETMVVTNQKVKQGDVIGSVGNTANFEVSDQPHLHFEVRKNDKIVSPMTYLPNLK